ncbi:hypothetical protein [Solibacillus sp. NPDC093137]|uniref:hypothetical protein n=1 Tax=Solibacillus sp. NPDC093137 TaxID=3390678 RepID=UPI003CFCEC2C
MTKFVIFDEKQAEKDLLEYVITGAHAERSACEKNGTAAQDALKDILLSSSDEKRHEYSLAGQKIIAKFVAKDIKNTNHSKLIEGVFEFVRSEALSQAITLDKDKLAEDGIDIADFSNYLYKPTYFVRFSPNKFAKSFNNSLFTATDDMYGLETEELVRRIIFNKERHVMLDEYYTNVMRPFKMMKDLKFTSSMGTVSKVANKPVWDINAIIQTYGDDFIIKYGKAKLTELTRFVEIGAIPKSVISESQIVIDRRLDFMVMTEEAERRAMDMYGNILAQKAKRNLTRSFA